jgi:hypothetical protein
VDAYLLLKCALTAFLTAGAVLVVMSLGVQDRSADEARSRGLFEPSGTLHPLGTGDLPLHYKFFHPATTAHWTQRRMLPLLTSARVVFAASLVLGVGTLMWLAA